MERRVLDFSQDGFRLSRRRGSLLIEGNEQCHYVPFDDIEAVIVHARDASYSNSLITALAASGIPLVACDQSHRPVAWFWPVEGNFEQARRMAAQLGMGKGLRARLWKTLVNSKIEGQAAHAEALGANANALRALASRLVPGDPENLEAQAAARYWPLVFGSDFVRDRHSSGANSLLNYGYTVLRACVARYVMAAGLHPSIGLHHHNRFNAFCLVDDVMEPFRPLVDRAVKTLVDRGTIEVEADAKTALVDVLSVSVELDTGFVPLTRAIERLAQSIAASALASKSDLSLPVAGRFFR